MADSQNIKFRIIGIKELEYYCKNSANIPFENSIDKIELDVNINVNYRWNLDKNLFGVVIDFIYTNKDKDGKKGELLKFSFITEFLIENLKDIFTVRASDDFNMDERFESTLVGLAISTGRGMLIEKTSGTILRNFIVPVVNPMELILSKKIKENKPNE